MKDFATILNEAFAAALKETLEQHKIEIAKMVDEKIAEATKNSNGMTDEVFTSRVERSLENLTLSDYFDTDDLDIDVSKHVDEYLENVSITLRVG